MLSEHGSCRFTNIIILLSSVRCHTGITLSETKLFKTVYIACILLLLLLLWYLVWTHDSDVPLVRNRSHSFSTAPATSKRLLSNHHEVFKNRTLHQSILILFIIVLLIILSSYFRLVLPHPSPTSRYVYYYFGLLKK